MLSLRLSPPPQAPGCAPHSVQSLSLPSPLGLQQACCPTHPSIYVDNSSLQAATIQSIGCMGFMNVGVQLGLAGQSAAAGAALALSAVCAGFVLYGFRRVKVGQHRDK